MRPKIAVIVVVLGAAAVISGERWYARRLEVYHRLQAERTRLAAAVDSLSAKVGQVDTLFIERARAVVVERAGVRDSLNRLLDEARARARACWDSTLDRLLADADAKLARERFLSDSLARLYHLRGDSLILFDQLRRRQLTIGDSLLVSALRRLKPTSRWGLGVTAGIDLSGRPNLTAGLTYKVRLPLLSP